MTTTEQYAAVLLPLYQAFTQYTPVIPKMYWDVYSQEERIKAICKHIDKLVAYANSLGIQINANTEEIAKLIAEFDEFKSGAYDEYYQQVIDKWVDDNMEAIISRAVRMVFFGLTSNGYFCAYIPSSWSDIQFDTGMVYGREDYGRLILRMDVHDGTNVIDNTYGSSGNYPILGPQGISASELLNELKRLDMESKQNAASISSNSDSISSNSSRISENTSRISENTSRIEELKQSVSDVEQSVSNVEQSASDAMTEASAASGKIDELEKKVQKNADALENPLKEVDEQ